MKKISLMTALCFAAIVMFSSCGNKVYKGFDKAENGVYYKVIEKGQGERKPQLGDYLFLVASYTSNNDSITAFAEREITDVMREHAFVGDLYDAYSLMCEGDHMQFAIKADSFFLISIGFPAEELPKYITNEDVIYFDINLKKIKSLNDFQVEEEQTINAYIQENNITIEPTNEGLYFISEQEGSGELATEGKVVSVHYTGKFLDGTIFDSSVERGEPMKFTLGQDPLIPGFTQAVQMMNKGAKATIIIPSNLGYGQSNPNLPIPPFTPLLFELEIIDIQ